MLAVKILLLRCELLALLRQLCPTKPGILGPRFCDAANFNCHGSGDEQAVDSRKGLVLSDIPARRTGTQLAAGRWGRLPMAVDGVGRRWTFIQDLQKQVCRVLNSLAQTQAKHCDLQWFPQPLSISASAYRQSFCNTHGSLCS